MAPEAKKEKAEEKTEAKAQSSSALGGFLPVIAVVVLVPVLSFVMVEYVLFPRLETRLSAMGVATAGDEPVEPAPEEAHAKSSSAEAAPTHAYEFTNIVSNLAGSMKSRYVKVSFTAYSSNPEFEHVVETNKAKLLDSALGVLSALSLADLESPGVKNKIRNELIFAFETAMGERLVEEIYFSEFVIQ
jgi:flagellar FliL protein